MGKARWRFVFYGGGGTLDAGGTILVMSLHRGPKYADQAVTGRSRGVRWGKSI